MYENYYMNGWLNDEEAFELRTHSNTLALALNSFIIHQVNHQATKEGLTYTETTGGIDGGHYEKQLQMILKAMVKSRADFLEDIGYTVPHLDGMIITAPTNQINTLHAFITALGGLVEYADA